MLLNHSSLATFFVADT